MDWNRLEDINKTLPLWHSGDGSFWADPYIAQHVLYAHLDSSTTDASRPISRIEREVEWIDRSFGQAGGKRVLDLGCGPGLHAQHLALRGWHVVGIDLSPISIRYAQEETADSNFDADFVCGDFLTLGFPQNLDLVFMAYGTLGTLSPESVAALVEKCRNALAPGGKIVFETFTQGWWQNEIDQQLPLEWKIHAHASFWNEAPHLVLTRTTVYPEARTFGRVYCVIEENRFRRFPMWYRWFSQELLAQEVCKGWKSEFYSDLLGTPFDPASEWVVCVVTKEEDVVAR